MSLYSDLVEVLTPYANKIKELATSDDQIKADLDNLEGKGLTEAQIDILDAIGDHINFSDSTGGALWDELIASLRESSGIVFVKEGSSLIISGVNNITNIVKNGTVLELRGEV